MTKRFLFLLICLIPLMAYSQWSDNANERMILNDPDLVSYIPKTLMSHNGSQYVIWVSSEDPFCSLCFQILDKDGYCQFPSYGFKVSEGKYNEIQNLEMSIDKDGNIIMAFQGWIKISNRQYDSTLNLIKMRPDGQVIWQKTIETNDVTEKALAPFQLQTNNDGVTYLLLSVDYRYIVNGDIFLFIYDENGSIIRKSNIENIPLDSEDLRTHKAFVTSNGELLFCYLVQTERVDVNEIFSTYHSSKIVTKKFTPEGDLVWSREYTGDSAFFGMDAQLDQFGDIKIICTENNRVCVLNYDSNGREKHPLQTIALSGHPTVIYNNPIISGFNSHGDFFVFWQSFDWEKEEPIVKASCLTETILPKWRRGSKKILSGVENTGTSIMIGDTCYLIYKKEYNLEAYSANLYAKAIDINGNEVWQKDILVSGLPASKSWFSLMEQEGEQMVLLWVDIKSSTEYNVMAQNINLDGSLGNQSTLIENIEILPEHFLGYNKANRTLQFSHPNNSQQYFLYNSVGKLISTGPSKHSVALPQLSPGIYIVNTVEDAKKVEQRKFFVY